MNNRLQQFLSAEDISQAQFADTIEVARASVSHVLAGRNKPGYDFIKSISDHYPKLNLEWLITGKGKMYKYNTSSHPSPAMQEQPEPEDEYSDDLFSQANTRPVAEPEVKKTPTVEIKDSTQIHKSLINQRSISKVIVFFDDNTFQELV